MTRFERKRWTGTKFWEIERVGRTLTTREGRGDKPGQPATRAFSSVREARREHDQLVAARRKLGYAQVGTTTAPSPSPAPIVHPRNAALEAALRDNRDDAGAYQVYADWLQAEGSPLGELIILEQALAVADDPAKRDRATTIADLLELPDEELATFGWRHGMWQWIRFENTVDWTDDSFDALALVGPVFESPLCGTLKELRLGVLRWERNDVDVPAVIAAAGAYAWARELRGLHLGDIDGDVDIAMHLVGDVGRAISASFPSLLALKVHAGEFELEGLDLPALAELVIETCSLSRSRLGHVFAAKLPALVTLELWFGSERYGAACLLDDVRPLLDGTVFAGITRLGLRNAEFTDELARALPTSPIAVRLTHLDLSMGTLTDAGAAALVAGAPAFAKLTSLSIDDNYLTEPAIRSVIAAFAGVTVVATTQKPADEPNRYVTVWE